MSELIVEEEQEFDDIELEMYFWMRNLKFKFQLQRYSKSSHLPLNL